MRIKDRFSTWLGGLREQASSSRPHLIGIADFYNEELDAIGEEISCWRLRGERDHPYRHRLALHVQEHILRLEDISNRLLNPQEQL